MENLGLFVEQAARARGLLSEAGMLLSALAFPLCLSAPCNFFSLLTLSTWTESAAFAASG